MAEPWKNDKFVQIANWLNDSYKMHTGTYLVPVSDNYLDVAKFLYHSPAVVVSHGTEEDPLFHYANANALGLWELSWNQFIGMPSRYSAEPRERDERAQMLKNAVQTDYIDNYQGIRISSTGLRFYIKAAQIWSVVVDGEYKGQAATFEDWSYVE